ncbi:MAG: hypothetical protein IT208_06300 [Chthonomonadales bacterium]|nr:hypothetical protein [Chthonomonadales bacterium]
MGYNDRMKVAVVAPASSSWGFDAYVGGLNEALRARVELDMVRLPVEQLEVAGPELAERLNAAQVVHIHHAHDAWGGPEQCRRLFWRLRYLIGRPVAVTAHSTAPYAELCFAPESRAARATRALLGLRPAHRQAFDAAPFVTGRSIVHTAAERDELIARGAVSAHVHVVRPGCPPTRPEDRSTPSADGATLCLFETLRDADSPFLNAVARALPAGLRLVLAGDAARAAGRPGRALGHGGVTVEVGAGAATPAADAAIFVDARARSPHALMAALASGMPVVAPAGPLFRETHADARCLRLFRPGDAAHAAATILGVLHNPAGRAEMSGRGPTYAAAHPWSAAAEATTGVYELLLADFPHHAPRGVGGRPEPAAPARDGASG